MILICFRSLGLINLYFTEYILSVIIKYQKLFLRQFTLCVITLWISLNYLHQPEIPKSYSLWGVAWLLFFQRLVWYAISCHLQFFLYMGWLFFSFRTIRCTFNLWIEIFHWCENLSYHLSEQYQGNILYIYFNFLILIYSLVLSGIYYVWK